MPQAEFSVFLSHNSEDKPLVLKLATKLRDEFGLEPWVDAWHLIPGEQWLPAIQRALANCDCCAVIVGPHGLGNVHEDEMWVALQLAIESKRSDRRFRVIPILLPNATRGDRARLPVFLTANTWVEFQRSIDEPANLDKLVKAIRGEAPGTAARLARGESPYRGLAYFDVKHAPLFFGREALTDWLLSRLRGTASKEGATRFLAMVGASGCGKSSLARAGVLEKLTQGQLTGSAGWPLVICRPESRPLESLATALANTDGVKLGTGAAAALLKTTIEGLATSPDYLHLIAQAAMPSNDPDWRLVVFVDQFEELFTLNQTGSQDSQATSPSPLLSADRVAFFRNLLRAATIENGRTIVMLTMRADFYGKCAPFPELAMAVSQHQELVGPMNADELRRAIETPAQLSGSNIEPGLVDLLVREVADQPGALPLLQYALSELWRTSRELGFHTLTTTAYHELGGWEGALSRHADTVLAGFKHTPQENLCRQLFLRLVQPGEGTEDTKRLVRWQELKTDIPDEAELMEQVVRKLADEKHRLITTSGDVLTADSTIEVVHEALIRGWPTLRGWLDADRAGLRIHRRLTEAANEWANSHLDRRARDPSLLYTGTRLAEVRDWARRTAAGLNERERSFVTASRRAEQRHKAREPVVNLLLAPAGDVKLSLKKLARYRNAARPLLRKEFCNADRSPLQRARAAYGLLTLGAGGADELAFLLDTILGLPRDEGENLTRALAALQASASLEEELGRRLDDAGSDSARSRLIAVALSLGITGRAAAVCALQSDPTWRTSLICGLREFPGDLAGIARTLDSTPDPDVRSALCAAVGRLGVEAADTTQSVLKRLFVDAPDGGTHSAADWALRQQGFDQASLQKLLPTACCDSPDLPDSRNWHLNAFNMTMLKIPARRFAMGLADAQPEQFSAFWMSDRAVSIGQFHTVLKQPINPAETANSELPTTRISWFDAVEFCNELSAQCGLKAPYYRLKKIKRNQDGWIESANVTEVGGNGYRLPTEKEWEYACRALSTTNYSFGSNESWLAEFAVFLRDNVHPGSTRMPNGWGLFDMHGNVWEWCWDEYDQIRRVLRGGSFRDLPQYLRSAFREWFTPDYSDAGIGFRVSRTP